MVETYQTEEEQVEALRKWWQENGRSTVAAIALALAAGFGWQGWQDHQQGQAENASALYEEMLEALAPGAPESPSSEQLTTGRHLAEKLKTEFDGSTYALFAGMHLARLAVAQDDLGTAEEELRWVLSSGASGELQQFAQLRLARVVAAAGETDEALKMLAVDAADGFEGAYAEARGDIYLQREEPQLAREAYQQAAAAMPASGADSGALQLKLRALNPVPAREMAVTDVQPDAGE